MKMDENGLKWIKMDENRRKWISIDGNKKQKPTKKIKTRL
jgi:hypothetical protein